MANFQDGYERCHAQRAGTYFWLQSGCRTEEPEAGSDQDYLAKDYITFTLMGNPQCHPEDLFAGMNLID